MSNIEIIFLVIVGVVLFLIFSLYIYHSIKMKPKTEKKEPKPENTVAKKSEPEQKPVPVGIIKEESKVETLTSVEPEYDLAPLREKPSTQQEQIKAEVKVLSPEMKKVIMSDLLKPKF